MQKPLAVFAAEQVGHISVQLQKPLLHPFLQGPRYDLGQVHEELEQLVPAQAASALGRHLPVRGPEGGASFMARGWKRVDAGLPRQRQES